MADTTDGGIDAERDELLRTLRDGGVGYAQLGASAQQRRVSLTNVEASVASLADVEHSKRVANREKDRDYLQAVKRDGTSQQ